MKSYNHIIISRTDNIGDVVLTLPMAALIKQQWPDCKVSFLARDYVHDVVARCPDVDQFICFDALQKLPFAKAAEQLASYHADVIIHVFPNKLVAQLAKVANIPVRIGTTRRLYHWWTCNQRINFTRKNSPLHEAQLNLALLASLGLPTTATLEQLRTLTHLNKPNTVDNKVAQYFDAHKKNIVIHPLTNGNTKEWPIENFIQLIQRLPVDKCNVIVTGTTKEQERLQPILNACPQVRAAIGTLSLSEFTDLLSQADFVLANSTGPLHIAAALGVPTLGLFPSDKGKDPGRWGPLGAQADYLVADECMQNISVAAVLERLPKAQHTSRL